MMGGTSTVEVTWTADWAPGHPEFRPVLSIRVAGGGRVGATFYSVVVESETWLTIREGDCDGDTVTDPVLEQVITKIFHECASGRADLRPGRKEEKEP